jgi:hypothetical protein
MFLAGRTGRSGVDRVRSAAARRARVADGATISSIMPSAAADAAVRCSAA